MFKIARHLAFILILMIAVSTAAQPSGTLLKDKEIYSKLLEDTVKYSVYLPPSYDNEGSYSYNVLYLLHGYGGNQNSWKVDGILDSLYNIGIYTRYIVVMPDAKNTYYINDYKGNYPYEDFFINELMPYIAKEYKPDTTQRSIICGLSMGGFGAVLLAAKHPGKFSASISLSGAFRSAKMFEKLPLKKYQQNFAALFGDSLLGKDRITEHWKQNSPYYVIESSNLEPLRHINWYLECGMQDFLFPANEAFHQHLVQYGIPHDYHIRSGVHNWKFWRQGFINALIYLDKINTTP